MIWGVFLKQGGKSVAKLYLTPAGRGAGAFGGATRRKKILSLSIMFWQDCD